MYETLISALKASGSVLLEHFKQPLMIRQKDSMSSIVTDADIDSESVIIEIIGKDFSFHNIISEESGFTDRGSEYTWVIDPLDGTSNFASGIPWFGVLIALFKGNGPVMGGAFLPFTNELFFAEKGKGTYLNDQPLSKIEDREMNDSLIAFCTDFIDDISIINRETEIYKHILKNSRNIRSTNCLLDFIFVAQGKFG